MSRSSLRRRIGKIVRAQKTHLLRKAVLETLEKRVLLSVSAPTDLVAYPVYGSEVDLTWTPVDGAQTYQVLRKLPADSTYSPIATFDATLGAAYADTNGYTGLNVNTTYDYEVKASDDDGPATGAPQAITTAAFTPALPDGSTLTVMEGEAVILNVTTNDMVGPTASVGATTGATVGAISQSATWSNRTQYNQATLSFAEAGTYYPHLTLTDSDSVSHEEDFTVHVTDAPMSLTNVPIHPTENVAFSGVVADFTDADPGAAAKYAADHDFYSAGIAWDDGSSPTTGTVAPDGHGGFTISGSHTYTDAGAHSLSVALSDPGGYATSIGSDIGTFAVPWAPIQTASFGSEIDLQWAQVANATSYNIYRGDTSGGATTLIANVLDNTEIGGVCVYHDTKDLAGLDPGKTYYYQVTAVNSGGESDKSDPLTAYTALFQLDQPWNSGTDVENGNFTLTINSNDLDGPSAAMDWGDGTSGSLSPLQLWTSRETIHSADHVYAAPGEYTATASVTDSNGQTLSESFDVMVLPAVGGVSATSPSSSEIDLQWTPNSQSNVTVDHLQVDRAPYGSSTWTTLDDSLSPTATGYNFDTNLLDDAHYAYRVLAVYTDTTHSSYSYTDAWTQPAATTALTATAISTTEIDLSWPDQSASTPTPTGINVYRSTNDSTFTLLTTTALPADTVSYQDTTGLSENTHYWYEIKTISGTTLTVAGTADAYTLAAIDTLVANDNSTNPSTGVGQGEIDLSWNPNISSSANSVDIWRSTDGGVSYSHLAYASGTATSYNDTGLPDNTTYYYKVCLIVGGVSSSFTDPASAVTMPAISGLTASPFSTTQIDVAWTPDTTASNIEVDQSPDGVAWSALTTLSGSAVSFNVTGLSEDNHYFYRVQALYGSGGGVTRSNFSDIADAWTSPIQNLSYSSTTSAITLTWSNIINSSGAALEVDRSGNNGATWTALTTSLSGTAVTYTDSSLSNNVGYLYAVRAVESGGPGTFTDPIAGYTLPNAPTINGSPTITATEVDLTWTNNSTSATSFFIERSEDGGADFDTIATTAPGATSYSDLDVGDGIPYVYEIAAATGDFTEANPSGYANATTPVNAPSDLTATAGGQGEIDVSWMDNSQTASGYSILRSTSSGGTFSEVGIVTDPTVTSFIDTGLADGTQYFYEVKATESSESSSPSSSSSATTLPPIPSLSGLTVSVVSSTELDLGWTAVTGATSYDIQREAAGGTWQDIAQISSGSTVSYHDTGLWDGVTYSYRMNATTAAATTDFCSGVSATTLKTLPIAPSNLTAVATTPGAIQLVWRNNAYNEDRFIIKRSSDGSTSWSQIGTTAPGVTTYTDSGLAANTTQYYEVIAENAVGDSTPSSAASATTNSTVPTPAPAAPIITGISIEGDSTPTVSFDPGTGGGPVSQYRLDRTYDGNWGEVNYALVGDAPITSLGDPIAYYGMNYTYRVVAVGPGGQTASGTISGTMPEIAPTEDDPDTYKTWLWVDGQTVTIHADFTTSHSNPQTVIDGFHADIYSGTLTSLDGHTPLSGGGVTGVGPDAWATIGGLADGNYTLACYTYNAAGDSAPALLYVTIAAVADTATPGMTVTSDGSTLTLTPAAGTSNLIPEYSPDGSNWMTCDPGAFFIAPGASGFIRASGTVDGVVGYTAAVAFSGATLAAPTGLTATPTSDSTVHLSWDALPPLDSSQPAVMGENVGQQIDLERSDDGGVHFEHLVYLDDTTTSWDDTELRDPSYTYIYRIRVRGWMVPSAIMLYGYSGYSATASAKTWCTAPTGINTTSGATEIDLHWTDTNEGETETDIQLSTDSSFASGVMSASVGPDVTSYDFTGLTPSTTYFYRLRCLPNGPDNLYWVPLIANVATTTALPSVSVSKVLDAAEEGPDGQPSDGYFEFTRTGDTSLPLTVSYTVNTSADDAATPGGEYTALGGTVTIAAGSSNAILAVQPLEINTVEGTKTVTLDISSDSENPTYSISETYPSAVVNIVNTDDVNITVASETVDVGQVDDIPVSATNHYLRPFTSVLTLSSSDASVLADDETSVTCASDGTALADATGDAEGDANEVATSESGSSGDGEQDVGDLEVRFDGNRNGTISFANDDTNNDATTDAKPFKFWINNFSTSGLDKPDWQLDNILDKNELESFSRVEVQVPAGFDPATWDVRAELVPSQADLDANNVPQIRLCAVESSDFKYVTDDASASALMGAAVSRRIGTLWGDMQVSDADLSTSPDLPSGNNRFLSFIFEGVTGGKAALKFVFKQPGEPWTFSEGAYLNIVSFQQMYARYTVGDTPGGAVGALTRDTNSAAFTASSPETNDVIVFVHGWRMELPEKVEFADTAFRRLYWQGFTGRFYAFDWPTGYVSSPLKDISNFDRSEQIAWNSAAGLRSLLLQLDAQYGYQHVNIFAHSMGNIAVSEALRLEATGVDPAKIIHTYVASQAAIAAEAYDPATAYPADPVTGEFANDQFASFQGGPAYFAPDAAAADRFVNFYNPVDYALYSWNVNVLARDFDEGYSRFKGIWYYQGTAVNFANPAQRYQFFSYQLDPPSVALGAKSNVSGLFDMADQVNMHAFDTLAAPTDKSGAVPTDGVAFTKDPADHSAEFLGTNMQRKYYWNAMMKAFGLTPWDPGQTNYHPT